MRNYPWWHPWNWIDPHDMDSWLMTIFALALVVFIGSLAWKVLS